MNVWARIGMLLVGLTLGLGMGAQARTAVAIRAQFHMTPPELEQLGYRLRQQERTRESLQAQAEELRGRILSYQQMTAAGQPRLRDLIAQLQRLKALAGLMPMEGPGVMVEMFDSRRPLRPGDNPNEVLLHNYDVAAVVGDLWAAGAEAMALNGERLVGTSGIRSVYTTMMVNGIRFTPPIQIVAIGSPDGLAAHVSRRGSYLDYLRAFSFPSRVTRANRLTVPAYRGALRLQDAKPGP